MTRQLRKLAHSVYECKYHIVFCPKYRYKILQSEVARYVRQQIYRLSNQKDGLEVLEVNVQPEHVHLVVSIPPKYAVSQVVGYIKGKSAIHIARTYLGRKKSYVGQHFWARGYFASTVGRDEQIIREYIRHQEAEDRRIDQLQLM